MCECAFLKISIIPIGICIVFHISTIFDDTSTLHVNQNAQKYTL